MNIVLTDPPEVVKLKREFSDLDMQEETLKARLSNIRTRKAAIAALVFQTQTTTKTNHVTHSESQS